MSEKIQICNKAKSGECIDCDCPHSKPHTTNETLFCTTKGCSDSKDNKNLREALCEEATEMDIYVMRLLGIRVRND